MDSRYNEPLEQIMSLIVAKTPRTKVIAKAREVKIAITKDYYDAQQAITFLDGMINRYTPAEDWPQGFWKPTPQPTIIPRPGFAPGLTQPRQRPASLVTRPERILDIARGLMKEGIVTTKTIAAQVRAEGDQRTELNLAVSIGNVLNRNGWHRVEPGKYRLKKEHENKGVK